MAAEAAAAPPPSSSSSSTATAASSSVERFDRRQTNQLRPPLCELGALNRADGSARFAMGQTSVLAAVFGPGQPRYSRKERIEGAAIEVTIHPHKGQATSADKDKEAAVRGLLEEAILTDRYPRAMIHVVAQVFEDDGGLLACVLNAAVLAAMDAGIEMRCVPLSVSLAVMKPRVLARTAAFLQRRRRRQRQQQGGLVEEGQEGAGRDSDEEVDDDEESRAPLLVLDPTAMEQKAAAAVMTMTLSSTEWGLLACHALGPLEPPQLFAALEAATGGAQALLAFVRVTVEAHARRTAKDDV